MTRCRVLCEQLQAATPVVPHASRQVRNSGCTSTAIILLLTKKMKYREAVHDIAVNVQLGCITSGHHHLWSECKQKGCVACPWVNKEGVQDLFKYKKGGHLQDVRGTHKFQGVQGLQHIYISFNRCCTTGFTTGTHTSMTFSGVKQGAEWSKRQGIQRNTPNPP